MDELRTIVQRMIDAGESEENIKLVIERYTGKTQGSAIDPTMGLDDMGSELDDGLSESVSWFDQTWFGRGIAAASTTGEATDLMSEDFSNVSVEAIQEFMKAKEQEAKTHVPSERMEKFQKKYKEEGSTWSAFFRGVKDQPGLLPELFVQSLGTQIGTLIDSPGASLAAVGTGAAAGAAATAYTGYGAIAGGLAGAMGGLATSMEAALTFGELIETELKKEGKEFSDVNIKELLEGPKGRSIRNKALGRGLAIGAIEGFTGGLAGKATLATKAAVQTARSGKVGKRGIATAAAAGVGVEAVGGGTGEVAGRLAAGQEMDPAEIGFEAITGTVTAPVNVGGALLSAKEAKYYLNDMKNPVTYAEFKDFVDTADDVDIASAKLKVEGNDFTGIGKKAEKKISDAHRKSQIDDKITDEKDIKDLLNYSYLRDNAKADLKKEGVNKVPDAEKNLKDIDAKIDAIISKYEGAIDIADTQEAAGVRKARRDASVAETIAFAETKGKLIRKDVKVVENDQAAQEAADKLGYKGNVQGSDGFIFGDSIIINKDVAGRQGAINVGAHELLHGVMAKHLKGLVKKIKDKNGKVISEDKTELKKFVSDFKNFLSDKQRKWVENELITNYQDQIKEAEARGENFLDTTDEWFNKFIDGIATEQITYDESSFSKLKSFFERIFRKFGYNKEFGSGRQTYDFLKDYQQSAAKGELSFRAQAVAGKGTAVTEGKFSISKDQTNSVNELAGMGWTNETWKEQGADFAIKEMQSNKMLDGLIRSKYKADVVPGNFVDLVYSELVSHVKNFKPEQNDNLFGWVNSQIANKAGNVYNREFKVADEMKGAKDIGKTTKEGEVKVQVAAETDTAMEALETEDLSPAAQAKKKADKAKGKQKVESEFRRKIGIETNSDLYNKVLDSAKKALLRAYEAGTSVRNIQRKLRDEANVYLFKSVKNFLGTKDYVKNLKKFREPIIKAIFTADLVQLERNVPDSDRVLTTFVEKLTSKQDVENAVNQKLLPPSALNIIDKGTAVSVYKKKTPTEKQFLDFFYTPLINPVTGSRSGLRGTRKDGLAKAMAGALSYDATMEVAQEGDVVEKRQQLAALKGETLAQDNLEVLAAAINRNIDVKFSKNVNPSKVSKISQYLKYQENKLGVNHPGFEFIYTIRQSVEGGLDLKTAYDNAKAALPLQSPILDLIVNNGNLNNLHIDNIVYGVNNFVLGKIRKLGHDSSVKYLKNKLKKATTNKQKVAIVNEYLKNIGRSVRSSMVDGITTNKKLRDEVIVPLGLGDFYKLEKAKPRGKKIMFRESIKTEQYEPVKLYENIEAIKNDPDGKRNKVNEQAEEARKYIKEILDSNLDNVEKKAIVQLMAYDQRGALRKLSKLGMNTVGLESSKTIMEHEFTVKDLTDQLNNYINGKNVDLKALFDKGKVHVLPKQLDQILRDQNISQRGDNRYENKEFKIALNKYIKKGVVVNAKLSKSEDFSKVDKAIQLSRSSNNPTKGITVLDFDDTLATTKSLVKFTRPDGTTGTLNAEQYASTYENLLDQGYTFDFSEFNKVVKGKLAPLFQKALKLQGKFGPENMFVLTARPPAAQKAIFDFLKANGLNIPIKNITGLGNSTSEAKALWIADKVGEGYNDFYFADDALQNVQAVDDVLSQLGVKRKVQQAKVKFSKSLGKDLAKNNNYTKFRNSLKGSVLYHGGTASLSDNKAVWFIASDIDGAELYAERRDGKVYSINSNNLNNAIIIPDVSDLIGLEKVIKNKYKSIAKEVFDEYGRVDIKKVLETDVANDVISDFMDYVNNNFELLDGVYGPETLYDNDGKISKGIPVIVLGGNVSTKVSKVKFSKSIQTIPAVANMLDQFDVKSKVQQARVKFSNSMNDQFNDILENVTGIESEKRFSIIKGRKRGESKGKFRYFVPPSHEDFVGLLYNFMGKGKEGNKHRDFLEQALVRPLNRANRELDTARQSVANDYKELNKQFKDVKSKLTKKTPDGDFTFQDAIRVYLWNKHGHKIPGLSETDQAKLSELVMSDTQLQAYAENLNVISKQENYVAPTEGWNSGDIRMDLDDATGRIGREQHFSEFIENADIIFSEENLNKIEAGYGQDVRESLEDMLYRIKTGRNRPTGQNKQVNKLMNYLNGSVGTVMFFNMRSALLQQMSIVNYINFADNNIFAAAKAFANQKQYWADWSFIFNSDMLKQRRGGIQTDVNGAELAASLRNSKDISRKLVSKLLQLGFLPTQIGDNIAIATGGATYYRNRINKYIKQGMSKKEAEAAAFTDFQDITQSTQQSARPDMVSKQQASVIGKVILNFQNVTSQFNRLGKKAFQDIYNRRITKPNTTQMQSDISNAARITYYFAVQNAIFYTLQTALFAMMFDDDEEDVNNLFIKKRERLINGSIDSVLRGTGLIGSVVATLKNVAIAFARQRDVKYNPDESAVMLEALNLSPVLGIKGRKIVNAEKTLNYNKKVIDEMETLDIDNPQWSAVTNYTEAFTNVPLNRLYNKTQNVRQALNNDHSAWERTLMFLGWSQYNLNLENKKMDEIKEKTKNKKKTNTRSRTRTRTRSRTRTR